MSAPATTQPTKSTTEAPLTAEDRCDRCGAQAYAKSKHGHGDLLWCAHHLREHKGSIERDGFIVIDETHRLKS